MANLQQKNEIMRLHNIIEENEKQKAQLQHRYQNLEQQRIPSPMLASRPAMFQEEFNPDYFASFDDQDQFYQFNIYAYTRTQPWSGDQQD